jgi:AcrR family transcriptional regulator
MSKGRPPNSSERQLPARLIAALRSCLVEKSHLSLTTAEIARVAGTQSSMITYYFGSKDGLQNALNDIIIKSVNDQLEALEDLFRAGDLEQASARFVRTMVEAYWADRPSASIWLIEAFRPESRAMSSYRSRTSWRVFIRLSRMVRILIEAKIYRPDLDPRYCAASLLSLVIGPLMIRPAWQLKEVKFDNIDIDQWIAHATHMVKSSFEMFDQRVL